MNFGQTREYPVRGGYGSGIVRCVQSKNRHVRCDASADADKTVFNDDAIAWRDAKMSCCGQEKAGIGLPRLVFVRAEYLASEVPVELCCLQVFLYLLSWATRCDTEGDAQCFDKLSCSIDGAQLCLEYLGHALPKFDFE